MRKDVKLAFVVGGILIAVLVVYVLLVPGKSDRPAPVTLETTPSRLDKLDQPAPATPEKAQKVAEKPAEPAKHTETAREEKKSADPTTKPTDPFASAGGDETDKWTLALSRGTVPMMTSAPQPPALQAAKTQGETKSDAKTESKSPSPSAPVTPTSAEQPATQPITSITSADQSGMRTHVVKQGETIAKIAEAVYGSQNYWPHIIRANPGIVAEKIRPGMTLNLPPDSEVKGSGTAVTAAATENPIKPDTTHPALDTRTEYEVQSGDSLAKISMKLYGTGAKWQAIYDLNKDAIGADPAKLKVKSVLKLPEPPTQKQQ